MWPNPQFSADLVALTEEILNGKSFIFWAVKTVALALREPYYLRKKINNNKY